jgi:uncharacterized SAM-binding protein YcdF (DUF218 family)
MAGHLQVAGARVRSRIVKPKIKRRLFCLSLAAAILVLGGLRWGGDLLISSDPLPARVDAAVVLQGSSIGERARLAGAMSLLQQGIPDRVLLSVPRKSYWGASIPPMARSYLEKNYGIAAAGRVDFCETGEDVNSTEEEARALDACIRQHGWQSIAVVTSNYHTRRAGMIWRSALKRRDPPLPLWVYAADDPEFQARGWWRKRLYAKTWLLEFTKLIWTEIFGWAENGR